MWTKHRNNTPAALQSINQNITSICRQNKVEINTTDEIKCSIFASLIHFPVTVQCARSERSVLTSARLLRSRSIVNGLSECCQSWAGGGGSWVMIEIYKCMQTADGDESLTETSHWRN